MRPGVTLSPQHGVNPSMMQCYVCMKEFGIALVGKLPGDREAPPKMCRPDWWCDECQALAKKGIILLSVRDGEEGDNPYRTGKLCALTEAGFIKLPIPQSLKDGILMKRLAFVPDSAWSMLGLPCGEEKEGEGD